jgi:MSHA biogenesis protein MshO
MRPTRPENSRRAARGVTLIELVVAIVLIGIIVAATAFFVYPMRQSTDLVARAELTDIADNALQRIGRDVRLALPNSVRVDVTGKFIEFLAIRAAGRYRADSGSVSGGADCPNTDAALGQPGNDQLSFDTIIDTCFKSIGRVPNANTIAANDFLVLNNYGANFTGQNAYASCATIPSTLNCRSTLAVNSEAARERISFSSTTPFQRTLHDSPGKRFYVISGPVSYACDTAVRTITRYSGYAIAATQPVAFGVGSLIAENVKDCTFSYEPNVAPQIGLLTMRVQLSKTLSGGETEAVNLYHAIHVSNVP